MAHRQMSRAHLQKKIPAHLANRPRQVLRLQIRRKSPRQSAPLPSRLPRPFQNLALPVVVKIHILNGGKAVITNEGKVPIEDIRATFSWHVLDVDWTQIPKIKNARVKESSYSSGYLQISEKELTQRGHLKFDLRDFAPFKEFPPKTATEAEALINTFYLFRFTFRDVRTGQQYACFRVTAPYLDWPSAFSDDSGGGGDADFLEFQNSIPGKIIAVAKAHYSDGGADLICEH
jgi:hypothetical protein